VRPQPSPRNATRAAEALPPGALECDAGGVLFFFRRSSQDWPQIASLYGNLARLTGSSVVELNHAVAIAEAGDVESALALVDRLELDQYHYLYATHAGLLRRLDRVDEARGAYERALELVYSNAERRFLEQRLAQLPS
jgi:RNA polymerase sigma-70 factor, ECF subfamily